MIYSRSFLALLSASILWGLEPVIVKLFLLENLTATTIVFYKFLFCCLALLPFNLPILSELKSLTRGQWLRILAMSLVGSLFGNYVYTAAFRYVNIGIVMLFEKMQPVMVIVLSMAFLKREFRFAEIVWVLVAVISSFFVVVDLRGTEIAGGQTQGIALLVGMATGYALVTLIGKQMLSTLSPHMLNFLRHLFATLILAGYLTLGTQGQGFAVSAASLIWLALIGVFAYALGFTVYYIGLRAVSPVFATVVELLSPLFGMILGYFFLAESFSIFQLVNIAVLVLSIYRLTALETRLGRPLPKTVAPV